MIEPVRAIRVFSLLVISSVILQMAPFSMRADAAGLPRMVCVTATHGSWRYGEKESADLGLAEKVRTALRDVAAGVPFSLETNPEFLRTRQCTDWVQATFKPGDLVMIHIVTLQAPKVEKFGSGSLRGPGWSSTNLLRDAIGPVFSAYLQDVARAAAEEERRAEEAQRRADAERRKAEEKQRAAEEERRIAEEKRRAAEEARQAAEAKRLADERREEEILQRQEVLKAKLPTSKEAGAHLKSLKDQSGIEAVATSRLIESLKTEEAEKARQAREAEIKQQIEALGAWLKTSDQIARYRKRKGLEGQDSVEAEATKRLYEARLAQEQKVARRRDQLARAGKFGLHIKDADLTDVPSLNVIQFFILSNPYKDEGKPVAVTGLIAIRVLSRREMAFMLGEGKEAIGFAPDDLTLNPYRPYRLLIVFAGMAPYTTGAGGVISVPTFYILDEL